MFYPRPMVRLAIVTSKSKEREIVEALYQAGAVQIEPHVEGTLEDVRVGSPMPESSHASALLVRVRALLRSLSIEGLEEVPHVPDPLTNLNAALVDLETNVVNLVELRDRASHALDALNKRITALTAIEPLGLPLELYHGYEKVRVFAGRANRSFSELISPVTGDFGATGASDGVQAAFVRADKGTEAAEALLRAGYQPIEVPEGHGPVPDAIRSARAEVEKLETRLVAASQDLRRLSRRHGALLLNAERILAREVEKAEAPVHFGATEYTMVVDCWVPADESERVQQAIQRASRGVVEIQVLDDGTRHAHRDVEPPTDYATPGMVRAFSPLVDMVARPKYAEVDPTLIVFLTFPLFFGFMIGDLAYGLIMIAMGLYVFRRFGRRSAIAHSLGLSIFIAGLWASLFGGFVFHDALGIPFAPHGAEGAHAEGPEPLSWVGLLGLEAHLPEPVIEKLGGSGMEKMLVLSIVVAWLHLFIGFLFGFLNEVRHSKRHAAAKLSWMVLLTGVGLLVLNFAQEMEYGDIVWAALGRPQLSTIIAPLLGVGLAGLLLSEGPLGGMESLGLLTNAISYTRLAGVAVAKGALIGAFNGLFLQGMVLEGGNLIAVAIGMIMFLVCQVAIFALGLLSAGIQAIRLNYVEFFLKFFHGGGRAFAPFGEKTVTPAATT